MKINIEMEAWELATVIKGLTISAQPEEKKPSGTEKIKPILSDKMREELRKAFANAFKVPERLMSEENPNPNYRPPMNQQYILTILSRRRGKNYKNELYFRGTYEQAREAAQGIRKSCISAGDANVRVEIWQVIATSYKGTVRG